MEEAGRKGTFCGSGEPGGGKGESRLAEGPFRGRG